MELQTIISEMELQKDILSKVNLDPSITPEKILQSMVIQSDLPAYSNKSDNEELVSFFLAYINFIVKSLPEGCVDGIWEDILWKTLCYSRHFCPQDVTEFLDYDEELDRYIKDWLEKALDNFPRRCLNPYIRLGLFHMSWLCSAHLIYSYSERNRLCITFMNTICEVQPHRLYPSSNIDDVVFSAKLMEYIFIELDTENSIQHFVSGDLNRHINHQMRQSEDWLKSILSPETEFVSKCIQIIGVLAHIARNNPDPEIAYNELKYCCIVFKECLGRMVKCSSGMPNKSHWMQFLYIFTSPHLPFRQHVVETIRELTYAIINYKRGVRQQELMYLRDSITKDLDVCDDTFKLPWLLLSRQVQGPKLVKQNSLMLRKINHSFTLLASDSSRLIIHGSPSYYQYDSFDSSSNYDSTIHVSSSHDSSSDTTYDND